MRYLKNQSNILLVTVLIFSMFSFLGSADAMQFKPGTDTSIDCDVIVTYGGGMRVSGTDQKKLKDIGKDDANRNFDQWDLTNNKFTALADIDLKHKNAGVFVRPKMFYDSVYMGHNANDSPATNNALAGGLINSSNQWAEKIEEVHGRNAELLDLFGYYDGTLFGRNFSFRVGKQVIQWGESLLLSGGIASAMAPLDASAAVAVGTEVKEILLPTEAAFLQMAITPSVACAGYYQWRWEKTKLMEGGTFFSRSDFLDELKAPLLAAAGGMTFKIPRGIDDEPRDDGQYGAALRWVTPWFSATEVGIYFINYHEKNPSLVQTGNRSATNPLGNYWVKYTEDIKLYGASVSSMIGEANVSGEVSYRQDVGILTYDARRSLSKIEMGDYWQAQVSYIYVRPLHVFADSVTMTGEVACGQEVATVQDEFGWAYSVSFQFTWIQVLEKTDFNLKLANSNVPDGSSRSLPLGNEDAGAVAIGVEYVYDFNFKAALTYENRYDQNAYADRDTISLKLSYTF